MPLATDTLRDWIKGLTSLRLACIQVNSGASKLSLDQFAQATIKSLLRNPASLANFPGIANQQFAKTGPASFSIGVPLNPEVTFATLNEGLGGSFGLLVEDVIRSFCPASCITNGVLDLQKKLTDAFPAGAADPQWTGLESAVRSTGLEGCVPGAARPKLDAMIQAAGTTTLRNLFTALSTF